MTTILGRRGRTALWVGFILLTLGFLLARHSNPLLAAGQRNWAALELVAWATGCAPTSGLRAAAPAMEATRLDPDNCANWALVGRIRAAQGDYKSAAVAWAAFAERYWSGPNPYQSPWSLDAGFWLGSAMYFEHRADWAAAANAYRIASYLPGVEQWPGAPVQQYALARYQEFQVALAQEPTSMVSRYQAARYARMAGLSCDDPTVAALLPTTNAALPPEWQGSIYRLRADCAQEQGADSTAASLYREGLQNNATDAGLLWGAARFARLKRDAELRSLVSSIAPSPPYSVTAGSFGEWRLAGFSLEQDAFEHDPTFPLYLFWSQVPPQARSDGTVESVGTIWIERVQAQNLILDGGFEWGETAGIQLYQPIRAAVDQDWQRIREERAGSQTWVAAVGIRDKPGHLGIAPPRIRVTAGHSYLVAGWVRGSAEGFAIIGCDWQGENLAPRPSSPFLIKGNPPSHWTYLARITQPPAGTAICQFVVLNWLPIAPLYVDDLLLVDLSR